MENQYPLDILLPSRAYHAFEWIRSEMDLSAVNPQFERDVVLVQFIFLLLDTIGAATREGRRPFLLRRRCISGIDERYHISGIVPFVLPQIGKARRCRSGYAVEMWIDASTYRSLEQYRQLLEYPDFPTFVRAGLLGLYRVLRAVRSGKDFVIATSDPESLPGGRTILRDITLWKWPVKMPSST